MVISSVIGAFGTIRKGLAKGLQELEIGGQTKTWRIGNNRAIGDHSNYRITKTSQNTEKSPGDLRRLAVNQTPVKNHQLTQIWTTRK